MVKIFQIAKSLFILAATYSLFIGSVSYANEEVTGKVVGVLDGDTVSLVTDRKKQIRIRMADIDAPEKNQPYGMKAKQMLSDLIFGKNVSVITIKIEKYGRTIGRIYLGNTNINLEMAKRGGAWAYREYLTDKAVGIAEDSARAKKIGLWALQKDQIIPPWEWRKGVKTAPEQTIQTVYASERMISAGSICHKKGTCSQMTTCKEAKLYLNLCKAYKLDRDGDGIPCESLCN